MTDNIQRADRVAALLENPDLQQAFNDVEQRLLDLFKECPTNDAESMVDIRKRLHLLDSVKANLHEAIKTGKLEAFRLEQEKRPSFLGDIWNRK